MSATATEVIFARREHGGHKISIHREGGEESYTLHRRGKAESYESLRQLFLALTGRYLHRSLDAYLERGRYRRVRAADLVPGRGVLDLALDRRVGSAPVSPPAPEPVVRGIDLENRSEEVAKLLYAGYRGKILSAGYDFDEVLQEVYLGLVVRNNGKCPWDPRKSSFGHYVHMVCGCVLHNYHKKQKRVRSRERIGMKKYEDGGLVDVDVADVAAEDAGDNLSLGLVELGEEIEDLREQILSTDSCKDARVAADILPLVVQGYRRGEIASRTGLKCNAVSSALGYLRRAV